jgi:hypothetical protein
MMSFMICIFHQVDDQINEDEIGGACGLYGGEEKRNLRERGD